MTRQLDLFGRRTWRPLTRRPKVQLSLTEDWLPWLAWCAQTFGPPEAWTVAGTVRYDGEWFPVAWDETLNGWALAPNV